jgi:hypothetical protein
LLTRHPKVTRHRELAATAQSKAIDRRDDRLAAPLQSPKDLLAGDSPSPAADCALLGELSDIRTRHERL